MFSKIAFEKILQVLRCLLSVSALSVIVLPMLAVAAVPVEDVGGGMVAKPAAGGSGASHQPLVQAIKASPENQQQLAQVFYQLQALQEEVQALRGLVEEQSHMLAKLKQQRLDDYLDLDRRLAELQKSGVSGAATTGGAQVQALASNIAMPSNTQEAKQYEKAYSLLKERKTAEALQAFQQQLRDFPQGQYAANAYYWSGEIHLLQNELPLAEQAFKKIIADFPADRKKPDAQFKLGKIYFQQGDKSQAKSLIAAAAASEGPVATLAAEFLKNNF